MTTSYIQIGRGNGPILSDVGLLYVHGSRATLKVWGTTEKIEFNWEDEQECDDVLARARAMMADAIAKNDAKNDAEWEARPWWRKLFQRKPSAGGQK